ncbi:hypothetical protein CANCADRAFT_29487 [Tortispora caseinolytica NRRL Y-17796]|uniref:Phospholipid/glycerol acyltransferase domain-containing protein n=1 Tax=Tortispora caseinolytica NRRL Y-17796 TaxID=767744 RepID=A0A1E4TBX5_9ASCO|nr:hypothetical protein CANCADRAFT_29487 [Tortispora caseinolytica NRRL Y-17796]
MVYRNPRIPSKDRDLTWNNVIYDLVVWIFTIIFDLFFREIQPRGAHNIPRHGPVIFVGAPHANQFVDPMLLMRLARIEAGRRVSFLVAEKSYRRKFIGAVARALSAIPVARPQDLLRPATGTISAPDKSKPRELLGHGTLFTKECDKGGLISIPKSMGTFVIEEIVDDTHVILRKDMKPEALEVLTNPSSFKTAHKVDQTPLYEGVFDHLHAGGCLGIFPEGGSHDRPNLLPLKAGVAIMALGTMIKYPDSPLLIVPCGMNYFHPHKFRSRAVIEFGTPYTVPKELVDQYASGDHQGAITAMLEVIKQSLEAVTVTCADYETLMVIQAARRLYTPPSHKIPLPAVIEANRRIAVVFENHKNSPQAEQLTKAVLSYNHKLRSLGIRDHQVMSTYHIHPLVGVVLLCYRLGKLILLALGALPGAILFAPVFIATKIISMRKAKAALAESVVKIEAKDVVATWKLLVAMGLAPALYWFYSLMATYFCWKYNWFPSIRPVWLITFISMLILPLVSYASMRIGEVGMDIAKSMRPLFLVVYPFSSNSLSDLRKTREILAKEITEAVNKLGPDVFPDINDLLLERYPPTGHSLTRSISETSDVSLQTISHDITNEKNKFD